MNLRTEPPNNVPLVSVVIPAYNCEQYLARAIASALTQSYANIECIVVNDGSTDGTADIIASFGDRIRSISQPNGGASAARNIGVASARGKYVAFLDADDYWLSTKIANQVEVFRRHPALVLVSCDFSWEKPGTDRTGSSASPEFKVETVQVFDDLTQLLRDPYLGTPTVIVDREALRQIGGFDTSLPLAEDVDMYFRLCTGHTYAILHQPLARFQLRHGSLTSQLRGYRDNKRVFDRLERSLPNLTPSQQALLQAQRMELYRRWISDLLTRGNGREARQILKESRQTGALPDHQALYLKSFIAPAMPYLRRIRCRFGGPAPSLKKNARNIK